MPGCLNSVYRIHRFCVQQLIYPLVLSSLLAAALIVARMYLSHNNVYRFLIWNLFLAWIPYVCSLLIAFLHQRFPRGWWLLLIPAAVWLIFLPNAPYIITDLWHLDERRPVPMWYDIGMLATFAWSGLFLGFASLSTMQKIVREYFGVMMSWLFALGAIGASGFGIYLGRFLDWNSWDLFFHPRPLFADIVTRFAHPLQNSGAVGFSTLFAAFLFVCYLTFTSIEHRTEKVEN